MLELYCNHIALATPHHLEFEVFFLLSLKRIFGTSRDMYFHSLYDAINKYTMLIFFEKKSENDEKRDSCCASERRGMKEFFHKLQMINYHQN